ncbi:hypothetical protein [Nocardioides sp. 503]|uniref:hypothetical protein n=1 Tax=Nocardioides sp. 503 TaxID=2508326 RepID=UPI00106F1D91|nr:hypothetical protein [Nocardioides sp. 503]
MAEATTASTDRRKNFTVGEIVDVERGTTVTRPDGSTVTAGKSYALDVPGTFRLGDREVTAK